MRKYFIPSELASELKGLDFNEDCFAWEVPQGPTGYMFTIIKDNIKNYPNNVITPIPTWEQVFDWIREEHGLCYFINFSGSGYCSGWEDLGNNEHGFENYKTYEEARLACLKKLIELLKDGK